MGQEALGSEFGSWLRTNGIHWSEMDDATTGKTGVFIDYRDANKRQEKLISDQAEKLGLKMSVGDKGVCFFES
jgi:hypothetical protein